MTVKELHQKLQAHIDLGAGDDLVVISDSNEGETCLYSYVGDVMTGKATLLGKGKSKEVDVLILWPKEEML